MIRTRITAIIIAAAFVFLAGYIFNLQVIKGSYFRKLSDKNCIRLIPQEGSRGNILDREGNVIVGSELSYDAAIASELSASVDRTLSAVSGILKSSTSELKARFKKGFIGRFAPVVIAKNISLRQAIALEELKPDYPEIIIQPHPQRSYPYGELASHAIGYLNEIDNLRLMRLADYGYKTKDIVGFGGVEEQYDYYLRQEEGGISLEVDHRGRFVRSLGFRLPKNGRDIQLTIDLRIQKIVEEALAGKIGCVILMDPYTGEIIAMESYPDFDPEVFVKRSNASIRDLFRNSRAPLVNRAISSSYPAGSVFKMVVAAAGLETGKINTSKTFFCSGKTMVGRKEFACWGQHGSQNLIGAIAHSCNVYFYHTGLLVGAQAIHDYALKFGFGRVTSIDLPREAGGFIPSPLWRKISRLKNWFDGDTANFSIGQGDVLVTPIQVVRMIAVFANGGNLVSPYIVKSIDGRDVSVYQRKTTPVAIKESTFKYIKEGLREVVSDPEGTASNLAELPVAAAGKTGTAQAPPGLAHGWFAGYFPVKEPKYAICVFLERVGAGYYAGLVAKQVIEQMGQEGLIQ